MNRSLLAFEIVALAFAAGPGYAQVARQAALPRPVDSARNLYEYCLHQAAKSSATAARYAQLANLAQGR